MSTMSEDRSTVEVEAYANSEVDDIAVLQGDGLEIVDDIRSTGHKAVHVLTLLLFIGVLTLPWSASLFGATSESIERRQPVAFPVLNRETVRDAATFDQLNRWFRDVTPLRNQSTGWYHNIWLQLDVSSDTGVVEGPGENFFLAEDFSNACHDLYESDELIDRFGEFNSAAETGGKEWLFLVAPDKAAILDSQLEGRAEFAAGCSREDRAEFQTVLAATGSSIDFVNPLIEAQQAEPGRWYYEHDSHWTFDAGTLISEMIVDNFEPGLFNTDYIEELDRALPINGDVFGRLGILRALDVPDNVQASNRPDIETTFEQTATGGTSTVRSYTNAGTGELIEGETLIVHDSMMNFAENQLSTYFEEIRFIHWDDLTRASFIERVAEADRVVMMRVERSVHTTIADQLINGQLGRNFARALATPRTQDPAPQPAGLARLADAYRVGASAIRTFTLDTGGFATSVDDLLVDPGVDGWAGPYIEDERFGDGSHPTLGDWEVVHQPGADPAGITGCSDINGGDCAPWLVLTGVSPNAGPQLDALLDGGDGIDIGRFRVDPSTGDTYFYSRP